MDDTAYHGRLLAWKKKELTTALDKSTKDERDKWRERLDMMDASRAGEDEEEGVA